jgi:hypothetical protein
MTLEDALKALKITSGASWEAVQVAALLSGLSGSPRTLS